MKIKTDKVAGLDPTKFYDVQMINETEVKLTTVKYYVVQDGNTFPVEENQVTEYQDKVEIANRIDPSKLAINP